ncbi:hypothetical protein TNCV_1460131 [Trichonephila clavipes]|nr:hypothetical protein TNCV_1460131 [Trichonephila clavipes]
MYGRANGNGTAKLRLYHAQFPDRRERYYRIFKGYIAIFCETRSFLVTRHDADHRRAVRNSSLEEIIFCVVADRPESSTRAIAHHVSVSHQTVYKVLNEKIAYTSSIFSDYKI